MEQQDRKTILKSQIASIMEQLKPLEKELRTLLQDEQKHVETNVSKALIGAGDFSPDELVYAATSRCECGAGMAYPNGIGMHGAWYCSAILTGKAEHGTTHSAAMPFSFYEVKSENQPSANGQTTRPTEPQA